MFYKFSAVLLFRVAVLGGGGGKEEERRRKKKPSQKKLTADDFSEDVATTLYPEILAS